jgi:hypothetical protein
MPTQREKLQVMADIAQKGEVAMLEKVFELQDALATARAQMEAIQSEQERDKRMTVEVEQPPVDLQPVIDALYEVKNALPETVQVDTQSIVRAIKSLEREDSPRIDYTPLLTALLNKSTPEKDDSQMLELLHQIASKELNVSVPVLPLSKEGRVLVEVDRTGGGGTWGKVYDIRGVNVNPATAEGLDAIVTAIHGTYTLLIDDVAPVTYIGEALPGTATSEARWRIKKIDETGTPDVTITYAGGGVFSQVWDNRASLNYN